MRLFPHNSACAKELKNSKTTLVNLVGENCSYIIVYIYTSFIISEAEH